jgi:hypothetical protein
VSEFYGLSGRGALRQIMIWLIGSERNCRLEIDEYSTQIGNSASDFNFHLYPECPNSVFRNTNYFTTDQHYKQERHFNGNSHSRPYRRSVTTDKSIRIKFGYLVYNPVVAPCTEFNVPDLYYLKINDRYYISDKIDNISNHGLDLELTIRTVDKQEFKLKAFSRWKGIAAKLDLQDITEYI